MDYVRHRYWQFRLDDLDGQGQRCFIKRAQAGDIDIVFFGITETEMWMWRDRGRSCGIEPSDRAGPWTSGARARVSKA
jgi:hypothetical protein